VASKDTTTVMAIKTKNDHQNLSATQHQTFCTLVHEKKKQTMTVGEKHEETPIISNQYHQQRQYKEDILF
jgi:hypothetical protein